MADPGVNAKGKQQDPPEPPRWQLVVSCLEPGKYSFQPIVHAEDMRISEIMHAMVSYLAKIPMEDYHKRMATFAQLQAQQRANEVAAKYPAQFYDPSPTDPKAQLFLCAACEDVYTAVIKADIVRIPPALRTTPIPCSYHLNPDSAPMPYEEAQKLQLQQEKAAALEGPQSGVKRVRKLPPKNEKKSPPAKKPRRTK